MQSKPRYKYRCVKCQFEFSTKLGGPVECFECGSLYVQWLNFDEIVTKEEIKKLYPNNFYDPDDPGDDQP